MPPRPSHALSAFAVWSGLYLAGATVYFVQLTHTTGIHPVWMALMAWAIGMGVYLLDRVKLKNRWLDPADQAARPVHHALITTHPRAVRAAAAGLIGAALLIALWQAPTGHLAMIESLPFLAVLGVVIYAARPRTRRPRPKDVLAIKNAFTATGITGLAIVLTLCWIPSWHEGMIGAGLVWAFAACTLWLRVLADAALCDLDDHDADTRFGTRTFPVVFGPARTRRGALCVRLFLAAALALIPIGPAPARLAWAAASAVSALGLVVVRPDSLRDPVDLSLGLEAGCVAVILTVF